MGYNTKDFEAKLQKNNTAYENNLENIRANQANPKLLSRINFVTVSKITPPGKSTDGPE